MKKELIKIALTEMGIMSLSGKDAEQITVGLSPVGLFVTDEPDQIPEELRKYIIIKGDNVKYDIPDNDENDDEDDEDFDFYECLQYEYSNKDRIELYNKYHLTPLKDMDDFWDWINNLDDDDTETLSQIVYEKINSKSSKQEKQAVDNEEERKVHEEEDLTKMYSVNGNPELFTYKMALDVVEYYPQGCDAVVARLKQYGFDVSSYEKIIQKLNTKADGIEEAKIRILRGLYHELGIDVHMKWAHGFLDLQEENERVE